MIFHVGMGYIHPTANLIGKCFCKRVQLFETKCTDKIRYNWLYALSDWGILD